MHGSKFGAFFGTGKVDVFDRSGTPWRLARSLFPAGGQAQDRFGASLDISGERVIVGTPGDQWQSVATGSAAVFRRVDGSWIQEAVLVPNVRVFNEEFGHTVAISGNTAAVGAVQRNGRGAVFVFRYDGTAWNQEAELTTSAPSPDPRFGFAVDLSGDTLVVGGIGEEQFRGAAYVYRRDNGAWTLLERLVPGDVTANEFFGFAVAVSGTTVVVGARHDESSTGGVYVYDLPIDPGATPVATNVVVSPVDDATGDTPVELEFGAVTAAGSTTVTSEPVETIEDLDAILNAPAPSGFGLIGVPSTFYDIETTADFSGEIVVCIDYSGSEPAGEPALFHFENGAWVDITDPSISDFDNKIVCGRTTSLSPFMVFEPIDVDPPIVVIASPSDDAVVGTATVDLDASVIDATETSVLISPGNLIRTVSAGGGPVQENVALVEGVQPRVGDGRGSAWQRRRRVGHCDPRHDRAVGDDHVASRRPGPRRLAGERHRRSHRRDCDIDFARRSLAFWRGLGVGRRELGRRQQRDPRDRDRCGRQPDSGHAHGDVGLVGTGRVDHGTAERCVLRSG